VHGVADVGEEGQLQHQSAKWLFSFRLSFPFVRWIRSTQCLTALPLQ
jgi:hypothetical protein